MTLWTLVNHVLSGYFPRPGYKPYVDESGVVHALSGTEALDATVKGQTLEGNRTFAAVRTGYEKFRIAVVEYDNSDLEETRPRNVIQR